jgi:hypothetical protein
MLQSPLQSLVMLVIYVLWSLKLSVVEQGFTHPLTLHSAFEGPVDEPADVELGWPLGG